MDETLWDLNLKAFVGEQQDDNVGAFSLLHLYPLPVPFSFFFYASCTIRCWAGRRRWRWWWRATCTRSRRRIISLCQMISADFSRFPQCAHLSGLPLLLSCSLPLRSSSFNKDDASSHAGGQCCQILRNCAKMAHLAPPLAHFESAFAHCAKSQKYGAFWKLSNFTT